LDLDETAVAPEATSALLESLAEPVAPIATAAAPMNWLTDDLFA